MPHKNVQIDVTNGSRPLISGTKVCIILRATKAFSHHIPQEERMPFYGILSFYSAVGVLFVHYLLIDNPLRGLESHNIDT